MSKCNLLSTTNKTSSACAQTPQQDFSQANSALGFLCRPTEPSSKEVKELAYISPVNPILDYTSLV